MRLARLLPVVVLGLATASLIAQTPPPPDQQGSQQTGQGGGQTAGQGGQRGAAQGGQRGRGGGRGRAAMVVMTLSTTAWKDGGAIPIRYTQVGAEVSPPLTWTGAPETTASFVLVVHDPDAAVTSQTNGAEDTLHWLVWNIPKTATALREAVPQGPELPDGSRQISQTGPYYRGPGAPAAGPAHHYVFELFALDTTLDIPAVGKSPAETRAAIVAAMAGHVRGKAVYTGTFKRPTPPAAR